MNSGIQWWGYVHVNGSLQLKRYFSTRDLDEARESPFVKSVHGPWEVSDRDDALDKLKREIDFLSLPLKNLGKERERDPVHQYEGKWWHWDEVWSDRIGPFESRKEAEIACEGYADMLDHRPRGGT